MERLLMLEKEVYKKQIDKLSVLYPNWKFDKSDATTAIIWYEQFEHMENDRFSHMVDQYIKSNQYNPTVKGLLECDTLPRKSRTQLEHEKMLKETGWSND